jgi:methylmalonyl-CoA/ethylmalonyl-CoA epimerase
MDLNELNMQFHHYGLAVRDPSISRTWLVNLGYHLGEEIYDPIQKVYLQLAERIETPRIELVWSGNEKSPIDRWIKAHPQNFYHICYEVDDIDIVVDKLRSLGRAMPLGNAVPAILFEERLVLFVYIEGLGLVELLEST